MTAYSNASAAHASGDHFRIASNHFPVDSDSYMSGLEYIIQRIEQEYGVQQAQLEAQRLTAQKESERLAAMKRQEELQRQQVQQAAEARAREAARLANVHGSGQDACQNRTFHF